MAISDPMVIQLAYHCADCGKVLEDDDVFGDREIFKLSLERVCTQCAAKRMLIIYPHYHRNEPACKSKLAEYLESQISGEIFTGNYERAAGAATAYRKVLTALRDGIFNEE